MTKKQPKTLKTNKNSSQPSTFCNKVYQVVKQIPIGKTISYKEVAVAIGRSLASRAVGNCLNKNQDSSVPCHRVIRSNGLIGGYNRGSAVKKKILAQERSRPRTNSEYY